MGYFHPPKVFGRNNFFVDITEKRDIYFHDSQPLLVVHACSSNYIIGIHILVYY